MKMFHQATLALILALTLAFPLLAGAADKAGTADKPYPLDTCIVTDEKLDADPDMKSYAFVHEGQEVKLCCKSCKKKFDKGDVCGTVGELKVGHRCKSGTCTTALSKPGKLTCK